MEPKALKSNLKNGRLRTRVQRTGTSTYSTYIQSIIHACISRAYHLRYPSFALGGMVTTQKTSRNLHGPITADGRP